jgi:hypothetical protein
LNLKKLGIKVILITVVLLFLTNTMEIDRYLRVALGVFGIGSGLLLLILNNFRDFDR